MRLEATEDTPLIDFDIGTGVFRVSGRALPEDAHDFFRPISVWLQDYVKDPKDNTTMEMNIDYFNSAATRYIFNMLMDLEDLVTAGKEIKVVWLYKAEDEMIAAKGEELGSMLDLPFEMKIL